MQEITVQGPPIVSEAERLFRHLNKHLFGDVLVLPLFNMAFDRRFGLRFSPESHHFSFGLGIIGWSVNDFLGDFVHEMVHMFNWQRGVIDCTSNQYHNQDFVAVATKCGLYVGKHGTRGWAITSLAPISHGPNVKSPPIPDPDDNARLLSVLGKVKFKARLLKEVQRMAKEALRRTPQKVFLVKWVCKCAPPHNCIRSGRRPNGPNPLQIKCMQCNSMFTAKVKGDPG